MAKLSSFTARVLFLLAVLFAKSTLAVYDSLWQPAQNDEAVGYSRVIKLQHAGGTNGKLLATFEHWYTNNAPSNYIIRESTNNGTTWDTLTTVAAPGDLPTQFYYQPFLFEFPQQLGKYAEGTILLVGNLQGKNATDFYSWRSTDHGKTWDPVGVWQKGWAPGQVNGSHGIWEPFLFLDSQSNLVAVFSDERENEVHSQKLVEVVSKDGGDTWSNVTDIVVGSEQTFRPGMATVAKMDNGEYFMSYEWCDTRGYPKPCSVHGKTSKDGVTWDASDEGVFVSSPDGVQASGSPYSIWDPVGKQLIVSSQAKRQFSNASYLDNPPFLVEDRHAVHINLDHGSGDWHWASAPWHVPIANNCNVNYSPNLLPLPNGTILYSAKTPAPQGEQCEQSTGAAAIGILPYNSDFPVTGDAGWIDFDGIWSVSGDQYKFPPVTDPATVVLTGSSGWTDYEISADAIVTSSSGVVGLLARASHLYTAPNNITRYTAAIDSSRGDFTLYRVGDKGATTLSSKPVPGGIKANQKYHLSLSVKSATLVATVTGSGGAKTSFSVVDDGLGRGMAGLFGSYGSGGFSNVQIKRVI
ncbi:hypothetical protein N7471_012268 [Penicillium samsonianum]|uniref:uncharacterized protein n=1 Tax=Penicillium samsonianum TaxID=1882272 RepID=UPI002549A4BE|nr:uncharacterized protein N7471_012268 [Penicillium samsonianum]KAJ6124951.1 hypothetical protein N7471_012268 [Penicillium samsonianum]